jgi:hypothetical protein
MANDKMQKLEPEDFNRLTKLKKHERPKVLPISVDARLYMVQSRRSGELYEVQLAVIKGDYYFNCNCQAAMFDAKCYHGPAAALVNMGARHLRRVCEGTAAAKPAKSLS